MHVFAILGLASFLFCLGLTPLCRSLAEKLRLVDRPDAERKFHLRPVPRVGGIPIALSYGAALLLVFRLNPAGPRLYLQHQHMFYAVLPAASIIFATGLVDDLRGLKPFQKLAGQVLASLLAVLLGARLAIPHTHSWLAIIASVAWLIGCSNAVNLIDGMDGLATGVGLLATVTTLAAALLSGNIGLCLATIPLAGCLLAFLFYNFNPASVFLGDSGSLTIGFLLGCFGLLWSQRTGSRIGALAPAMALAVPLLDVALAISRRFLRSVPITRADRGHIHHRILALGFSTRAAALILYAVCAVFACLAVLASFSKRGLGWPVLALFCLLVLFGIDRLAYVEFRAAGKTLHHQTMLRAVQDEIYLHELKRSLLDAKCPEDWWAVTRHTCGELGFATAEAHLDGQNFQEAFVSAQGQTSWRIVLALGERGSLLLTRLTESPPPPVMTAVLNLLKASIENPAYIAATT